MAALKGCHCNHCRSRHKPGSQIPGYQGRRQSSRHNSCSKIYTGDEHWTKVLQASEGQGPSNRQRQPSICDRCHHLHMTHSSNHCSLSSSSTSAFRNPTNNKRAKNVFQSLYSRFCDWFGSSCQGFGSSFLSRFTSCSQSPFDSFAEQAKEGATEGLLVKVNLDDVSALLSKSCKRETRRICNYTSQSSEESEFGSVWTSCSSSSSLTVASNSTVSSSEGCVPCQSNPPLPVCFESTCLKEQVTSLEDKRNSTSPKEQSIRPQTRTAYHLSTFKINGFHLKSSSLSLPEREMKADHFCRTWPLSSDNQEDSDKQNSVLVTSPSLLPLQDLNSGTAVEEVLHEPSIEWSIPYTDLTFDQIVRCGARHQIFRGRWHGDVLIHTYCDLEEKEVIVFLKQVSELSRIRHENICLFMGACIHLPNLAVITSDLKGPSLYEKIHLLSDKMSMRSRVNIARQVSVAMGYLHAKGVLARKLNSRNIHLEPKVKLSLLDHGMTETVHQRSCCACLPRGNLCYIAPEMLSTLTVMNSRLHCISHPRKKLMSLLLGLCCMNCSLNSFHSVVAQLRRSSGESAKADHRVSPTSTAIQRSRFLLNAVGPISQTVDLRLLKSIKNYNKRLVFINATPLRSQSDSTRAHSAPLDGHIRSIEWRGNSEKRGKTKLGHSPGTF